MSTAIRIEGSNGRTASALEVQVSPQGALVTAPFDYDLVSSVSAAVVATAYNLFKPRVGKQFVITAIKMRGSKDVSTTVDATVEIYEASAIDSTTVDRALYTDIVVRFESTTLGSVNILVNEGKFINAKTDDNSVQVTMTGYFVPVNQEVNT